MIEMKDKKTKYKHKYLINNLNRNRSQNLSYDTLLVTIQVENINPKIFFMDFPINTSYFQLKLHPVNLPN